MKIKTGQLSSKSVVNILSRNLLLVSTHIWIKLPGGQKKKVMYNKLCISWLFLAPILGKFCSMDFYKGNPISKVPETNMLATSFN